MIKQGLVYGVAALFAVTFASGCRNKKEAAAEKVIPVRVSEIVAENVSLGHHYVGTVEEAQSLSLSFSVSGNVDKVLVCEGEKVKKGQLLAILNRGNLQSAYDAALSTLHQAQDGYDRLLQLHEKGSLTDMKWVEMQTDLQKAKSTEAIARKNLEDSRLHAPRDGVVSNCSIEAGENVTPNLGILNLIVVDRVKVKTPVPENEISAIRIGQPAQVTVPAAGNSIFHGKVEEKGVLANPVSHTYEVRIGIDNIQWQLMPGMVGKVYLQKSDNRRIVVPARTVQLAADGRHFVWLAVGSAAKQRFVQTGDLAALGVVINEGLQEGDLLITDGYHKVSEGMRIEKIWK
ncbi:MAG: efflux RND transporter periplasmic adaptor subunit [Bacteroidales bacterium]|jgi:RND family efflux transporter MFP subunit|nr:efflux RND transporter periplasmic adaptor subunit [Bacteroidales bacterium]